jgi:hypothetical protein
MDTGQVPHRTLEVVRAPEPETAAIPLWRRASRLLLEQLSPSAAFERRTTEAKQTLLKTYDSFYEHFGNQDYSQTIGRHSLRVHSITDEAGKLTVGLIGVRRITRGAEGSPIGRGILLGIQNGDVRVVMSADHQGMIHDGQFHRGFYVEANEAMRNALREEVIPEEQAS